MNNEDILLNSRQLRDQNIGRFEILDKVKELLLIPSTELATVQQVADFYEVGKEAVEAIYTRHKGELTEDDMRVCAYKEFSNFHNASLKQKQKGKAIFVFSSGQEFEVATRGIKVFPRRAILRVGMLLRDSTIAREVRTQLLNIEDKAAADVKIADIEEEQKLMLNVGIAYASGDLTAIMLATTNMMGFKNRYIKKLETTNRALANGILKWEDRSRLNFALRKLSNITGVYYAKLWNELYKQLKYKYHIDVKARTDKNYISTIKENEWEYVIKSFSSLCKHYGEEPADMFNNLVIT